MVVTAIVFTSCDEKDDTWDPYYSWQTRNEAWYAQIADSARTAISEAQALYKDDWEDHCDWRMYKSLLLSQEYNSHKVTDSICVHIVARGEHAGDKAYMPCYNDTVRLNYRGWLMSTEYEDDEGNRAASMSIFAQTYYGAFSAATAAPSQMGVSSGIEGYATALQYMTPGDDWNVYIPQQLAYKETASAAIPAYSTLLFRINLVGVYPAGTKVPTWKAKPSSK